MPFAKETTHNVDYTEKPLPEHYRRSVEPYKPSSGEFDGRTTYRVNYIPLEGERAKIIKPAYEAPDPNREFSVGFFCLYICLYLTTVIPSSMHERMGFQLFIIF